MTRETIGRYEIRSEIGRGGMAAVYLAYDPNFRRNVAIKLVSVNLHGNLVFRERFEREAQLIAKIEHPAIVPVYDFGEQDNQPYLVMRYMPGGGLASKIKEGAFTLSYASQILSQIAPALDAVHAQGIVHRDLKPANILLDGFGNPAISDFGIAHITLATTDLTGSAIIGTPSYMSPEQVRGDHELDGRSDIYALGVILFEMLAGSGPFRAATPLSVAMKHLTEPIPSILSSRPDLPTEVEFILKKAMAKDREMRYANAAELVLELRGISDTLKDDGKPVTRPIKTSNHDGLETEIDASEDSNPAFRSSSSPQVVISQAVPQSSKPGTRPRRLSILQIAGIAGLGLFLFFLCSSLGIFGAWRGLGLPGFPPRQSPTVPPTLTATQDIVLFDDFSDPANGWPIQEGYSYQQNGYHIFADEAGEVLWAKTAKTYSEDGNISIHVDVKPVTEGMNGYYGLLCRFQDGQNFYYFVTRKDGGYLIGKYKNGDDQPLFSEGWSQSDAIKQGNQTNRLKADCAGNTLRFYANNVMLGEVVDTDFISGFSGIVVAALDAQGFEVTFNNFLITKAGQ